MAAVTLGHNITRQEDFEPTPPGTLTSVGGGAGAAFGSGLHYEATQAIQRRIQSSGSDHGFMYTDTATVNMLNSGLTVWLVKAYTAIIGLTEQKIRCGSVTTAYHEYLIGDDGTEGDNQDFLAPAKGGYSLIPIHVAMTAWINRGITGSPDITAVDVYGVTHNVTSTTGAGDSSALDAIDLTDEGLFLWGGDGADPDGVFANFRAADEGAGLSGAARAGLWASQAGIFFVYGKHTIGRQDGGTVTATVFTDSNKTIVFPGGYVNDGFNGFEFDLGNGSTAITWTGINIIGRGRSDRKRYFDTARDVNGTTERITIPSHGFNTGDQVAYSAEGGADDIGPDATTGQSELVGAGGPGTGDRWYIRRIDADTIELYNNPLNAFGSGTTGRADLTAASAPGENHSLRRRPDTRPDIDMTGTSGSALLDQCIIQNFRQIIMTSVATIEDSQLISGHHLEVAGGQFNRNVINQPTVGIGQAFCVLSTSADLANIDDNEWISGGLGHAIQVTTTGTTVGWVGNTFSGYGPGTVDDTGVHDNSFDTITDVDAGADTITIAGDPFVTGDPIYYSDEGGSDTIGLTDGALYYVRRTAANTYQMHPSARAATDNTDTINLSDGSTGETHVLYSANAAFHNSTGGTITLNVAGGGEAPSVRNSNGSTTIINNNVSVTFTGMQDGTEIRIYAAGTTTELAGTENATDGTADNRSFTASLAASISVDIRFAHTDVNGDTWIVPPKNSILGFSWPTSTTSIPITQVADRVFNNP